MGRILFFTVMFFCIGNVSQAQTYYYYPAQPQVYYQQPIVYMSIDANSFCGWLNATRAAYGLGGVAVDQNLSNWAQQNNAAQNSGGLGHYVMGPARRQNSAWGNLTVESVGAMWMNSPGHREALLDPTITWIGIAASGAYITFNAY